jgi:hypothetical protein
MQGERTLENVACRIEDAVEHQAGKQQRCKNSGEDEAVDGTAHRIADCAHREWREHGRKGGAKRDHSFSSRWRF